MSKKKFESLRKKIEDKLKFIESEKKKALSIIEKMNCQLIKLNGANLALKDLLEEE